MTLEAHDDDCPGCKPALLNIDTGEPEPDNSPIMQVVFGIWDTLTLAERQAWHRVTCQNSREPADMRVAKSFAETIQKALGECDAEKN
jgi:hypothetical protein